MKLHFCLSLLLFFNCLWSQKIEVGQDKSIKTIKKAIELAKSGDTIIVNKGIYREGNIIVDKKGKIVLYRAIEKDFDKINQTLQSLK